MRNSLVGLLFLLAACKRDDSVVLKMDSAKAATTSAVSHADSSAIPECGVLTPAIITDEGLGELKLGQSTDEVRRLCEVFSESDQPGQEGTTDHILAVRVSGEIVPATIVNGRVWRISLTTPHFRTADSLGVDTPLRRIAQMRGAQFAPGEDAVYGFASEHCGLSFRFSLPLRPPSGGQWTPQTITAAHGDAVVDRVLIRGCTR